VPILRINVAEIASRQKRVPDSAIAVMSLSKTRYGKARKFRGVLCGE
jgi:hypothetical protein